MPNEQVNPGRPTTAAPSDFSTDPETGITYIKGVPFSGDGSEGIAKEGVALATVAALPTCTYDNGDDGVGATLTGDANGLLAIDGDNVANGQRVLIQDESDSENNGIYVVTELGSGGTEFVLTRATDFNASTDIQNGASVICQGGDVNAGKTFYVSSASEPVIGTNAITFAELALDGGASRDSLLVYCAISDNDPSLDVSYDNGASGVGATITAVENGVLSVDGVEPPTGESVLVGAVYNSVFRGIYEVTNTGSVSTPFVLTRRADYDTADKITAGSTIAVRFGTINANRLFYMKTPTAIVVGSDAIEFGIIAKGLTSVVAGTDINIDSADPDNPIINLDGFVAPVGGNAGESLVKASSDDGDFEWKGRLDSITGGAGIAVDNTDPANPVVSVVGAPYTDISNPEGGVVEDAESRAAIISILSVLRDAGILA